MRVRAYLSALPALLKKQVEQELYRVYVTDALKIVCENTERFAGGYHLSSRYLSMINPTREDNRTEAEIIAHVKKAWGGEAK